MSADIGLGSRRCCEIVRIGATPLHCVAVLPGTILRELQLAAAQWTCGYNCNPAALVPIELAFVMIADSYTNRMRTFVYAAGRPHPSRYSQRLSIWVLELYCPKARLS